MKLLAAFSILTCLVIAHGQNPTVDLPRGLSNASADSALMADSAVIVSIPANDQLYIGNKLVPKDRLGATVVELIKQSRNDPEIVFVAASANVNYQSLVETIQVFREHGIEHFGLVVNRENSNQVLRGIFLIEVPGQRDPAKDLAKLTPNPLMLVTFLDPDLQLSLNHERGPGRGQLCFGSVPGGLGNDPANLQKWLACLFENRTKQHAYKIGMETRSDVPAADRIEKTVFVKAPLSVKYGDVVRVINAVKGAGANPIGLQIDDLPN